MHCSERKERSPWLLVTLHSVWNGEDANATNMSPTQKSTLAAWEAKVFVLIAPRSHSSPVRLQVLHVQIMNKKAQKPKKHLREVSFRSLLSLFLHNWEETESFQIKSSALSKLPQDPGGLQGQCFVSTACDNCRDLWQRWWGMVSAPVAGGRWSKQGRWVTLLRLGANMSRCKSWDTTLRTYLLGDRTLPKENIFMNWSGSMV